ncbi:MAG TPA: TonB-dependent receptor [Longimicrobiales bacterium]|nr:TonB-dependent receptor [Longimicrobiales bacterium]
MSGFSCEARSSVRTLLTTALMLGVFVVAKPAEAQTGSIAGLVTSAQGGQPLSAAQVYISTLDLGVLTQANGRYVLINVPAGTHTLTAERIGYRVATAEVTVGAGETVVQNFMLTEEALQLDEVIVTGTAGGSQRRAIGNVVAAVDVADISASAPISTVEDALLGRTPGVHLIPSSGAGGGSKIRIRGHSSMALAGDPIIYVDGVRLNDNRTAVSRFFNQSRLADFDPNNIESIEIIKGPAAATLYGTEASNGVIQIVTKRGQSGAPVWDFSAELGQNYWPDWEGYNRVAYAPNPATCPTRPCGSESDLLALKYADLNKELGFRYPWQNGLVQHYTAAVRGGTDIVRYSFSLSRNDQDGIVYWNTDERNSVQANLGVTASEKLNLQLSGGFFQGIYQPPESFWGGEYGWGGIPTGYFRSDGTRALCGDGGATNPANPADCTGPENRGWRDGGPERYDPSRYNHFNQSKRSTWSLQTNLDLTEWLSHRLTLGIDQVYEREELFYAREGDNFWWGTNGREGDKTVRVLDAPVYTADFSGTATFRLMDGRLGTATSYGAQYYSKAERRTSSHGEVFPVRALSTVSSGSRTDATETFVENTTLGFYIQEQFDWDNRIFVTAAVRRDDNSAFGSNFGGATYPKLSATWVMHEESFWNIDFMDQFRLRGAWGQAGKQPDAFAATQLYSPETGPGATPILTPSQYGNPDLGPEKGEELEVGFDASFFEGRIGAAFTYYTRTTKDAIVGRTVPPSLWPGFAGDFAGGIQFVNIGQTSGWGTETSLNVQAITEGPVRFDLDLAFTTQGNRIDDMGDIERIQVGRARAHYEGFSIAAASDFRVLSADFQSGSSGPVENITCDGGAGKSGLEFGGSPVACSDAPQVVWGPTDPTRMVNVTPTLTILDDWRLSANVDAQWGHWVAADYATARHTSHPSSKLVWLQDDPIGMAYINVTRNGLGFHKGGFAKLREVSLSYNVPSSLAERVGASSANIRVGARNVARLWLQQECVGDDRLKYCEPQSDPEVTRGEYIFAGEDGGGWPSIPQWTVRLGLTF